MAKQHFVVYCHPIGAHFQRNNLTINLLPNLVNAKISFVQLIYCNALVWKSPGSIITPKVCPPT